MLCAQQSVKIKKHFNHFSSQTERTLETCWLCPTTTHLGGMFDWSFFTWWILCVHQTAANFFVEIHGGIVHGVQAGDTDAVRLLGWGCCESVWICPTGFEREREIWWLMWSVFLLLCGWGPLISGCLLGCVLKQWVLLFMGMSCCYLGILINLFAGVIYVCCFDTDIS